MVIIGILLISCLSLWVGFYVYCFLKRRRIEIAKLERRFNSGPMCKEEPSSLHSSANYEQTFNNKVGSEPFKISPIVFDPVCEVRAMVKRVAVQKKATKQVISADQVQLVETHTK
ncbi:MAG: hypothetical protein RLZ12_885 [Bacillota bacterium]|jgi:hypothetical protein